MHRWHCVRAGLGGRGTDGRGENGTDAYGQMSRQSGKPETCVHCLRLELPRYGLAFFWRRDSNHNHERRHNAAYCPSDFQLNAARSTRSSYATHCRAKCANTRTPQIA